MSNFVNDCINGDALLTDIDDYIDQWHDGNSDLPLHEFLGMTKAEYNLFLQDEQYLGSIIAAHKEGKNIAILVKEQLAMAARSDNQAKSKRIEEWLKDEGLWD
jgi:hypothetical protein